VRYIDQKISYKATFLLSIPLPFSYHR